MQLDIFSASGGYIESFYVVEVPGPCGTNEYKNIKFISDYIAIIIIK